MDFFNSFELLKPMMNGLGELLPKLFIALLILLIGWLFAKLVRGLVKRLLSKINFSGISDKLNDLDVFGSSKINFNLSSVIGIFAYYLIMLLTWLTVADVLNIDAISELLRNLILYLPQVLTAVAIFIIGIFIADAIRKLLHTALESFGIPAAKLISGFVFYFILINIAISALSHADVNIKFLASNFSIIIGGVVLAFAIGYGLASKDIASNILSGFYWKNKFETGDTIIIDGVKGKVIEVDKSRILLSNKSGTTIIPLQKVMSETVTIVKKKKPLPPEA